MTSHLDRARAESFGSVAADYDRYRPSYPSELVDDLVTFAGSGTVLDIGTGTGKAARLLAARGVDVLGVEIDPLMAEVARGHGLSVEVGSFEGWDDAGRTFDLIIAAQAWHWVDPAAGAVKLGRLLTPGGLFAPFWNFEELGRAEHEATDPVYAELAPELLDSNIAGRNRPSDRPYVADLEQHGSFASVDTHVYRWARSVPVDDWVGRVGTHSDHLALGPDRLVPLQQAIREALRPLGPAVHTTGGTYQVRARMAG